jgi:hypothetical protein
LKCLSLSKNIKMNSNRPTKQGNRSDSRKNGRTTRTSNVDSEEQHAIEDVSNTTDQTEKHLIDVEDNSGEMEQPTVTNWASETKAPGREIVKLEPADAERIDNQTVGVTSINDLLRVLVARGTANQNPALAKGAERLLLQLNCVPFHNDAHRGARFGGQDGSNNGPRGPNNGPNNGPRNRNFNNNRDNGYNQNNRFNNRENGYNRPDRHNGPDDRYNNNRGGYQDRYDRNNDQGFRERGRPYQQQQQGYQNDRNFDNGPRNNRYNDRYGGNQNMEPSVDLQTSDPLTSGPMPTDGSMRTFEDRRGGFNKRFQQNDNNNRRGGFRQREPNGEQQMDTNGNGQ